LLAGNADGAWTQQQIWQGAAAIHWLEASPRGDYLILVDANNQASQFILSEQRLAEGVLQLPAAVSDVMFSRVGNRVFLRTSRWVHQASSTVAGLTWQDSVFAPPAVHGSRIVVADARAGAQANRIYQPAARNGFVELVELGFAGSSVPGLFGSRDELLDYWLLRLEGNAQAAPGLAE
jgi:hypothetical protein